MFLPLCQAVHTDGGPGVGLRGRGAGHGGQGGQASVTPPSNSSTPRPYGGGLFYGDVVSPAQHGSNGLYEDFVTRIETIGGGVLRLNISGTAHVDGM